MSDLLEFLSIPLDREDRHWAAVAPGQGQEYCHESSHEALDVFLGYHPGLCLGDLRPAVLIESEPNPDAEDPDGLDAWRERDRHELRLRCVVDTEQRPLEHQLNELSFWRWVAGLEPQARAFPSMVRIPDPDDLPPWAERARKFLEHRSYPSGDFQVVAVSRECLNTYGWGRAHVEVDLPGRERPADVPNYLLEVVEWKTGKEGQDDD